jgi:uncharacterized protein YggE
VVWAAPPYIYDNFKLDHVMGDVKLLVRLDEDGHVWEAKVRSSPNAQLNGEAIDTARYSVFQTEVRDCRPIQADLPFTVTFKDDPPAIGGTADKPTVTVTTSASATYPANIATFTVTMTTLDYTKAAAVARADAASAAFEGAIAPFEIAPGDIRHRDVTRAQRITRAIHGVRPPRGIRFPANGVVVERHYTIVGWPYTFEDNVAKIALARPEVTWIDVEYTTDGAEQLYSQALDRAKRYARFQADDAAKQAGLHVVDVSELRVLPWEHRLASVWRRPYPSDVRVTLNGVELKHRPQVEVRVYVTATYVLQRSGSPGDSGDRRR